MVVGDVNHRAKCLSILFHFDHFPDSLGLEQYMQDCIQGITHMSEIHTLLFHCFSGLKIHT